MMPSIESAGAEVHMFNACMFSASLTERGRLHQLASEVLVC